MQSSKAISKTKFRFVIIEKTYSAQYKLNMHQESTFSMKLVDDIIPFELF